MSVHRPLYRGVPLEKVSKDSSLAGAISDQFGVGLPTPPPTPQYGMGTSGQEYKLVRIPLLRYVNPISHRRLKVPFEIRFECLGEQGKNRGIYMGDLIKNPDQVGLSMVGPNDQVLNGSTTSTSIMLFLRIDGTETSPLTPQYNVKLSHGPGGRITTTRLDVGMQVAKAVKRFWSIKPYVKVTNTTEIDLNSIQFEQLLLRKVSSHYEGGLDVEIAAWC